MSFCILFLFQLKAFYVDLLVPLETNLEKDTKVVQVMNIYTTFLYKFKYFHVYKRVRRYKCNEWCSMSVFVIRT